MEKRVIIAVVLSILVISLWHKFTADMYQESQPVGVQEGAIVTEQKPIETAEKIQKETPTQTEKITEKEYVFENEQFVVTFSNIGGCIKRIDLKEYKDDDGSTHYNLMSEDKTGRGICTIMSQRLDYGSDVLQYSVRVQANTVEYSTTLPKSIKATKRYIFKNKDLINLEIEFENLYSQIQTFEYDVIGGVNIEAKEALAKRYVQVDAKVNNAIFRNRNARHGIIIHPGEVQWSALKNKYFAIILKPFAPSNGSFVIQYKDDKVLGSGIRMAALSLSPGAKDTHNFFLYLGPKKPERLALPGMGFEEVIHYGVFGSISKFLLSLLKFFYSITRNWGISIIILGALMNLILAPLTRKSLKSMQKMQMLQPEIKKLQEKHKKNSQKMNKEIMELYKKYNINPLGGCFPMMLQMPVFIALFQGLMRFIELKNASFLWIRDLSLPDSVILPFLGKDIHILPLLMAGAMFFQQKFSHPQKQAGLTEQQRQQQRMMAFMMPILFGFIFYNFPSGLVLYWFTNTLFMTVYQITMMRPKP